MCAECLGSLTWINKNRSSKPIFGTDGSKLFYTVFCFIYISFHKYHYQLHRKEKIKLRFFKIVHSIMQTLFNLRCRKQWFLSRYVCVQLLGNWKLIAVSGVILTTLLCLSSAAIWTAESLLTYFNILRSIKDEFIFFGRRPLPPGLSKDLFFWNVFIAYWTVVCGLLTIL